MNVNAVFSVSACLQFLYLIICSLGPLISHTTPGPRETIKSILGALLIFGVISTLILWFIYFILYRSGHDYKWLAIVPPTLFLSSILLTVLFYQWPENR